MQTFYFLGGLVLGGGARVELIWFGRGVGTPILGHGREVPQWWPPFWGFSIRLGPYFIPQHNLIDPSFCRKNRFVSITFSSRDTRTYQFFPWFSFSLILDLFDPSFSQKRRSYWVQTFFTCWTRLPKIW